MKRGRAGMTLVVSTGILSLLLLVASSFASLGRSIQAHELARSAARSAGLSAASGLEYAAARLSASPFALAPKDLAGRGDAWTVPSWDLSEPWTNLSYAHGEPWFDDGNGIRDPGEAAAADIDGDGLFTNWSGRLRGEWACRFALRVASNGGRIPLNAGYTGPAPEGEEAGAAPFHTGLAHALNNLGAIVLPPDHPCRRVFTPAVGGEPLLYSTLGDDLLGHRPAWGYHDWDQVRRALAEAGHPIAEDGTPQGFGEILPHLTLEAFPSTEWPSPEKDDIRAPWREIELMTASREVLESLWRYVSHLPSCCYWETGASALADPLTGTAEISYQASRLILTRPEAAMLAGLAIGYREAAAPDLSWTGLYAHLTANAAGFSHGLDGHPIAIARYRQAKVDLAFTTATPDPHPHPCRVGPSGNPWTAVPLGWSGWGTAKDQGTLPAGPFPFLVSWNHLRRVRVPGPGETAYNPFVQPGDPIIPLCLTTRPPRLFAIEARGRSPGSDVFLTGDLSASGSLFLGSQEEFENLHPSEKLPPLGIRAVNDAAWPGYPADTRRRGLLRDDPSSPPHPDTNREYRRLASLPRWDIGSLPAGLDPFPLRFSNVFGALALAGREEGPRGADLYWAFGESPDGAPQEFPSESATGLPPIPWRGRVPIDNPQTAPPAPSGRSDVPFFTPYGIRADSDGGSPGLFLTESIDLPDGCPGCPRGSPIRDLTIEGWFRPVPDKQPKTVLRFYSVKETGDALVSCGGLTLNVQPETGASASSLITLGVNWWCDPTGETSLSAPGLQVPLSAFADHHLRVRIQQRSAIQTFISLFVDGAPVGTPLVFPGEMHCQHHEVLDVFGFDDIRIYAGEPPDAAQTHAAGKYVRRGSYLSPLYVLESPSRLGWSQWTGVVPLAFPPPPYPPGEAPITVTVTGYRDAGGGVTAGEIASTGTDTLIPLSGLGPVRSFRYRVDLAAPNGVPDPLLDTPVFESIQFVLLGRPSWNK